ncbi:hypothetical protein J4465_01410 [Candidatus Pacearchaeota archaeon]|nr:hypothetical protein [Candidatus Pacearchaeota archaeon]
MTRIIIFGDSVAYGAWDSKGGWVERLKEFLDKRFLLDKDLYFLTYNLGISGNTTKDVLERFEFESRMRFKEKEETIIVFSIGGNDCELNNKKNKCKVSIEELTENIIKLIKLSRKFSNKIVFTGLTPTDESKMDPIPWNNNFSYKNSLIKEYDETIQKTCREQKVPFINLLNWLDKKDLEDGCHPNSKGHEKIFNIVKEFLIKNKII